ncbi:MAG TPA: tetratricopeptide repeat protein [Minicystis sp.]|nr:tetratricopeptide repeat protein [Minicystis sp.]
MRRHAVSLLVALSFAACDAAPPAPPPPKATAAAASAAATTYAEVPITTSNDAARQAFEKGRDLQLNTREAEAIEELKKAVAADPGFSFARAWLGYLEIGEEGTAELARAMDGRQKLPEPERLSIEELAALRAGEHDKARELARTIVKLAPFDWRAQLDLGNRLYDDRKYDEAVVHFGKAAAFGPKTPAVYNALGYGYLQQHKVDAAVAAFRKYAELEPDEPNALDSLGEALLDAGKFAEAEVEFKKAADMNFSFAWDGVAQTRFLRGDWAGGLDANAHAKEAALRPIDKIDSDANGVWALLAHGDDAEAEKRIDALEKDAQAAKYDEAYAVAAVYRGIAAAAPGKEQAGVKSMQDALDRAAKAKLPGSATARVERLALSMKVVLETLAASPDVEKTAAQIFAIAAKAPDDVDLASLAALGRGAATLVKGDAKAAVVELARCVDQDYVCRYELLLAEEKVPDPTSAEVTKERILAMNLRDAPYLWIRAKAAATGTAAAVEKK